MRVGLNSVAYSYNIPLGSHSLQCLFRYEKKGKQPCVVIGLQGFGGLFHEAYRWSNLAALAAVYASISPDINVEVHRLSEYVVVIDMTLLTLEGLELLRHFARTLPFVIQTGAERSLNNQWVFGKQLPTKKLARQDSLRRHGGCGMMAASEFNKTNIIPHDLALEEADRLFADIATREKGLELYAALVVVGISEGYQSAIEAAGRGLLFGNKNGIDLYKKLFAKEQGFDAASIAARQAVRSEDPIIRENGLSLYINLVVANREEFYREATQVAFDAFRFDEFSQTKRELVLFDHLLKRRQGVTEAIQAATNMIFSENIVKIDVGLRLFNILFSHQQGLTAATTAARAAVVAANFILYEAGLRLYASLVDARYDGVYREVTVVAGQAVLSSNFKVRHQSMVLFKMLFERGIGFSEAAITSGLAVESSDDGIHEMGLDLYRDLVLLRKPEIFSPATRAAAGVLFSNNSDIRLRAISLFVALFEQDLAESFSQAIRAANEAAHSDDIAVCKARLQLYVKLISRDRVEAYKPSIAAFIRVFFC